MTQHTLEAFAALTAGRDNITTAEFAKALNIAPQTARKNYCLTGECYGIRPGKIGNRLQWPVQMTASLITGGAA